MSASSSSVRAGVAYITILPPLLRFCERRLDQHDEYEGDPYRVLRCHPQSCFDGEPFVRGPRGREKYRRQAVRGLLYRRRRAVGSA